MVQSAETVFRITKMIVVQMARVLDGWRAVHAVANLMAWPARAMAHLSGPHVSRTPKRQAPQSAERAGTRVRLRIICLRPPPPGQYGAEFGLQDNSTTANWS